MSRPLRLEFADALYYITARGNARNLISLQEDDFALHYSQISRIIAKYKT
jgi:putative transposase